MKRSVPIIAALHALAASSIPALAQYPTKPITLVVPFAAGGGTDAIARIISAQMSRILGQSIIVENIAGAGGTTATRRVAEAAADGYTLVMGHMGTHGAAPAQYANLKYDPVKDFTPIGLTAGVPTVLVTRKDFPADSLPEFVDYVRKNARKVNEAHAGVGGHTHTTCTLLQSIMGTETGRVAYRGVGPAVNDLITGQVDFVCAGLGGTIAQIQSGKIKAIAIAGRHRAELIKDVPTAGEGGMPEFDAPNWNAIFAPKNLPPDILAKLNDAMNQSLNDEPTRKRLIDVGGEIPDTADRTSQALRKLVESEVARWSAVLKAAGMKPN